MTHFGDFEELDIRRQTSQPLSAPPFPLYSSALPVKLTLLAGNGRAKRLAHASGFLHEKALFLATQFLN